MPQQVDTKLYIEQFLKYTISDVEYLIKKFKTRQHGEETHAGPMLMCVVNGIDAAGGIIYGFNYRNPGPGRRSADFMEKYMDMPLDLAEFIYTSVRCGASHHGMPRLGIIFGLWDDTEWHKISSSVNETFCKNLANGNIWVNVVKLAHSYLDAVRGIERDFARNPGKYQARDLGDEIAKAKLYHTQAFGSVTATTKDPFPLVSKPSSNAKNPSNVSPSVVIAPPTATANTNLSPITKQKARLELGQDRCE